MLLCLVQGLFCYSDQAEMPWQEESLALGPGLPVTRCSGHSAGEDALALTEKNLPIILKSSPLHWMRYSMGKFTSEKSLRK